MARRYRDRERLRIRYNHLKLMSVLAQSRPEKLLDNVTLRCCIARCIGNTIDAVPHRGRRELLVASSC